MKTPLRKHRKAWGAVLLSSACCLGASRVQAEEQLSLEDLDATRAGLEQWVEAKRLISKEEGDWEIAEEMLKERIKLANGEIRNLQKKIQGTKATIGETEAKQDELRKENNALKASAADLADIVTSLEERTRKLLARVPAHVAERVKLLSQRFPEDPKKTTLSLSERYQNVVGVLNELNKFNREISVTSEVRTLPDGSSAEVTTLYVGLGQAYYVNTDATIAGIGKPSADAWVWTPANEAASQIASTIAILKNEEVASFVQLPLEIK